MSHNPNHRMMGRPREVVQVNVDYADVLTQAVANERARILREVVDALEKVDAKEYDGRTSYSKRDIGAERYKESVLSLIRGLR